MSMKPFQLVSHERSVTQVKYNKDGDLIFTASKSPPVMVWRADNGMRLGTYEGDKGAIATISTNHDTTRLLTGSAANTITIWDVETGKELSKITTKTGVRTCGFSSDGRLIFYTTESQRGFQCELAVLTQNQLEEGAFEYISHSRIEDSKITAAAWGPFDEEIITGHENGKIRLYSAKDGNAMKSESCTHQQSVTDLKVSSDYCFILTSSKDFTSKLSIVDTLETIKNFVTDRPVNSAAISSIKPHVVMGGGQEAQIVTTSSTTGRFDARIFHIIYEQEIGRVKGHFGPINSIDFDPMGKGYCSGGEDGIIRVHKFPSSYYDFDFDK